MQTLSYKYAVILVVLGLAGTSTALMNISEGKPVTLNGTFGVLRPGAPWSSNPVADAQTIVDGVFLPEQTTWNEGSVWWDTSVPESANNNITIDFGGLYHVLYVNIQADNNDWYYLDYLDADNNWVSWAGFPDTTGFGLVTRYSVKLDDVGLDRQARAVRIRSIGWDDGYLAVSEFQALGEAVVPGPAAALPVLAGLALTAACRRRR